MSAKQREPWGILALEERVPYVIAAGKETAVNRVGIFGFHNPVSNLGCKIDWKMTSGNDEWK